MTDEERKLKQKAASKRYYEKHKFDISEKRRGQRKEEHKATYAKLLEKYGREELAKKSAAARARNPEKHNACVREARLRNPERTMLNRARSSAKRKGLEFNLKLEDIRIPDKCPLLEMPFNMTSDNFLYVPSLDRIDNTKGYIKGNVWVISNLANKMKNEATKSDLLAFCKNGSKIFEDVISYV